MAIHTKPAISFDIYDDDGTFTKQYTVATTEVVKFEYEGDLDSGVDRFKCTILPATGGAFLTDIPRVRDQIATHWRGTFAPSIGWDFIGLITNIELVRGGLYEIEAISVAVKAQERISQVKLTNTTATAIATALTAEAGFDRYYFEPYNYLSRDNAYESWDSTGMKVWDAIKLFCDGENVYRRIWFEDWVGNDNHAPHESALMFLMNSGGIYTRPAFPTITTGSEIVGEPTWVTDEKDIINDVILQCDGFQRTGSDAASIARYGTRTLRVSRLDITTTADADVIITGILSKFKDPKVRVKARLVLPKKPDGLGNYAYWPERIGQKFTVSDTLSGESADLLLKWCRYDSTSMVYDAEFGEPYIDLMNTITELGAKIDNFAKGFDQSVTTTSSPIFAGLTVNGDILTSGKVDGVDLSADFDQALKTTSTPTFAGLKFNDVTLQRYTTSPGLEVVSPDGSCWMGALDSGFGHFGTDRPAIYLNKPVSIAGHFMPYTDGVGSLGSPSRRWGWLHLQGSGFNGRICGDAPFELRDSIGIAYQSLIGLSSTWFGTGTAISLGDATHAGGDINVYKNASNVKALFLDASKGDLQLSDRLKVHNYGLYPCRTFQGTDLFHTQPLAEGLDNSGGLWPEGMSGSYSGITTWSDPNSPYTGNPPWGRVFVSEAYQYQYSDYIPVNPGATIYTEIWCMREVDAPGTAGTLYVGINRYDKDKKPIAALNGQTYTIAAVTVPSDGVWHRYSGSTTLPLSHTPYDGSDGLRVAYIKTKLFINYNTGTIKTYYSGLKWRDTNICSDGGDVGFSGNLVVGGTVDGVDIADHTHDGSASDGARVNLKNLDAVLGPLNGEVLISYVHDPVRVGSGTYHTSIANSDCFGGTGIKIWGTDWSVNYSLKGLLLPGVQYRITARMKRVGAGGGGVKCTIWNSTKGTYHMAETNQVTPTSSWVIYNLGKTKGDWAIADNIRLDIVSYYTNGTDLYDVVDWVKFTPIGFDRLHDIVADTPVRATFIPATTIASSVVRESHDAEFHDYSSLFHKVKTITYTYGGPSVAKVSFDIKAVSGLVRGRVYKNGLALGTDQSTSLTSYTTKTENLTLNLAPGDTLELWIRTQTGLDDCYVRNFRVSYDFAGAPVTLS